MTNKDSANKITSKKRFVMVEICCNSDFLCYLCRRNGIALSWNAPAEEETIVTGYRIYREYNNGEPQLVGTKIGLDNTHFNDMISIGGLQPNTSYWYYVVAFNNSYESPKSNTILVTTPTLTGNRCGWVYLDYYEPADKISEKIGHSVKLKFKSE